MPRSLDRDQLESVAAMFAVLAEPTRLSILQTLKDQPLSVNELVRQMQARQANVSKQLGILYQAGLVDRERHGNEVHYSICEPMIFQLCDLVCGKIRRDAQRQLEASR